MTRQRKRKSIMKKHILIKLSQTNLYPSYHFLLFYLYFFSYFPDNQLMSDGRGYDEDYLKGLSALKVRIPLLGFGSRFVITSSMTLLMIFCTTHCNHFVELTHLISFCLSAGLKASF